MENLSEIIELQEFDNLELIARQVVEGFITGLHKSPFHGFSVEFAEHRIYNQGESTKHIDWKLYGRTDKLFVKRYEEETNLRCHILLDTSPSMLFPFAEPKLQNKLTFSVYAAAALAYLMRRQRDAVGLATFSNKLDVFTPAKVSLPHAKLIHFELSKLLQYVSSANILNLPHHSESKIAEALHAIAEQINKRSLVIIFSDMFYSGNSSHLFNALQHLRYNGHEVILFHVTYNQYEKLLNYKNRLYRFVDLESGATYKLNPNDIREQYVAETAAFIHELKLKCGQFKIDFIEADVANSFREVLIPYLLKREKLF